MKPQVKVKTYSRFSEINGSHDYKRAVPHGFVEYSARRLHGGRVLHFNFELAEEMGLVQAGHRREMNAELEEAILDAFALQIINEYDILNRVPIPASDIKPGRYMATRYLQLQHPDKRGTTSGDGRSLWNGQIKHRGMTWDITSCGTGATCLSPAHAIEGKFFRTADPNVSYGCGTADVYEGYGAALMSEILYRNGIATERTLAILEFANGRSINVRAGKCLLRPSHFFSHLKQRNREALKSAIDFYIARVRGNGDWKPPAEFQGESIYRQLAAQVSQDFARATARFETDYLFVWLDWDGDNCLTDGGIIDYGSVRQFGLFHHRYRFDDDDRWSTNIPEQKKKAREIVQTFVQIADFIDRGERRTRHRFKNDSILKYFDAEFERHRLKRLLFQVGLNGRAVESVYRHRPRLVKQFQDVFSFFERICSKRGPHRVPDGITHDAVFCMRDVLRELPRRMVQGQAELKAEAFIEIAASKYATPGDRKLTPNKAKKIGQYYERYISLVRAAAQAMGAPERQVWLELADRASQINLKERITGESVLLSTTYLMRNRSRIGFTDLNRIFHRVVESQDLQPKERRRKPRTHLGPTAEERETRSGKMLEKVARLVAAYSEEI